MVEKIIVYKQNIGDLPKYFAGLNNLVTLRIKENMEKLLDLNPFKNSGIFKNDNFLKSFGIGGGVKLTYDKFKEELKKDSLLKDFFSKEGRYFSKINEVNLKGVNQVLPGLDKSLTVQEKVDILKKDLEDFLLAFEKLDTENIKEENLPLYIGVFSYGKNTLLTLLNALVAKEKIGEYNLDNPNYLKYKYILSENLELAINYMYDLILEGTIKKDKDFSIKDELDNLCDYIVDSTKIEHFSRPEILNPLVILGFTYNMVLNYENTDLVISMPSGGTELGLVQKYLYKKLLNKDVININLPISIHSVKDLGQEVDFSKLDEFSHTRGIYNIVEGKNILIIDDNSATGGTLQRAFDFLNKYNPKSINCHTAEADLRRIKAKLSENDKKTITFEDVFKHSVGIAKVSSKLKPKVDLNEIGEKRLLKKYFQKQAEKYKNENNIVLMIKYLIKADLIDAESYENDIQNKENITTFKNTWLSNFYPCDINYNGIIFPSTEHAYFYSRYDFWKLKENLKKDKNILNTILYNLRFYMDNEKYFKENDFNVDDIDKYFYNRKISPKFLKKLTQQFEIFDLVSKSYSRDKLTKMIELSLIKYQIPELQKKLLDTGNKKLIEGNIWGDIYWGVDLETGKGNNLLGRVLMYVRDFYRK